MTATPTASRRRRVRVRRERGRIATALRDVGENGRDALSIPAVSHYRAMVGGARCAMQSASVPLTLLTLLPAALPLLRLDAVERAALLARARLQSAKAAGEDVGTLSQRVLGIDAQPPCHRNRRPHE